MLPVKDYITTNVLAAINEVRFEGGFNSDVAAKLVQILPAVPDDSACVLLEDDPRAETASSLGHDGWYQPYIARAWIIEPEENGDTPGQRLAIIAADIMRAVMRDPHQGDLAHNTNITGIRTYPEAEPPAVDVMFEVHFRHLHGNPFEQ